MAKIKLNKIQSFIQDLQIELENRTEKFDNRSEKWQDSEKGEAYSFATDELEEIIGDLGSLVDQLESWIKEN